MKQIFLSAVALAVVLAGCGPKAATIATPHGTRTTASKQGAKVETSAPDDAGANANHDGDQTADAGGQGRQTDFGVIVSEADLGLPFYPGSQESRTGSTISNTADGKDVLSVRTTKDEPQKVGNFYKNKISNASISNMESNGTKMVIMSGKLKGSDVTISAAKTGDEDTRVSISITYRKGK
ncbi:MAG TPA: hypothetical protein VG820_06005 [Fimbriimonadaceae bacterium]|nr:hypothetical protein [Fimbriimonadaceae bacterium]